MLDQSKTPAQQFFSFAIPATINMILTSFITVIDGLFVGRFIGESALAAISLNTPILLFFIGITLMFSVGGSVRTSHALGAQNPKEANKNFNQCFVTIVFVLVILFLALFCFLSPIARLLSSGKEVGGLLEEYTGIMRFFYPIQMLNMTFYVFFRVQGKPQLPLFLGLIGNVINIILDYLFIVRFNLGIKGAAFASGISIILPFLINFYLFSSRNNVLFFDKFKFEKKILVDSIFNGSSEFIGQISTCVCIIMLNIILLKHEGKSGVAAYSIIMHICNLQAMIITGFTIGLGPIVGFYYGAKNKDKIFQVYRVSIISGVIVGIIFTMGIVLFHTNIAQAFAPGNERILNYAKLFYSITSIACVFNGVNFLTSSCFTAMGKAKESFVISILRGMLIYIILGIILPPILKGSSVWFFYPTAEILTMAVSVILINRYYRKVSL